MKPHTANELSATASILGPDGDTVLTPRVACGITNLSGRRLEQAQMSSPQTTHMLVFRTPDAAAMTANGYVLCEEVLYIVDYTNDPRNPRAGVWMEVFCHADRSQA